eukprot:TRINITY_DN10884_c0_g1_i4.p1 TRINITY_DN10884_c0_g1~~TRINITY_DN10884_c0_g1_i4.p1  ORF type:complete len:228 (+),score=51.01 TRINITY_DN10884_c0_g1_i4:615-1298(+)
MCWHFQRGACRHATCKWSHERPSGGAAVERSEAAAAAVNEEENPEEEDVEVVEVIGSEDLAEEEERWVKTIHLEPVGQEGNAKPLVVRLSSRRDTFTIGCGNTCDSRIVGKGLTLQHAQLFATASRDGISLFLEDLSQGKGAVERQGVRLLPGTPCTVKDKNRIDLIAVTKDAHGKERALSYIVREVKGDGEMRTGGARSAATGAPPWTLAALPITPPKRPQRARFS